MRVRTRSVSGTKRGSSERFDPTGRGSSRRTTAVCEAYKAEQESLAKGERDRFLAVLDAYQNNPDVTVRRLYIETMERILAQRGAVVLDGNLGDKRIAVAESVNQRCCVNHQGSEAKDEPVFNCYCRGDLRCHRVRGAEQPLYSARVARCDRSAIR